jgi:hypothetical protein
VCCTIHIVKGFDASAVIMIVSKPWDSFSVVIQYRRRTLYDTQVS